MTEYLTKERADDDEPALFVTKQGKRVTALAINADIAKWCKTAGIQRFGSDRFRNALALDSVNAEVSDPEATMLLGNASPKSVRDCFSERSDHPTPGFFRRLLLYFKKS